MEGESQPTLLSWLDSPMANYGLSIQAREELSGLLGDDDAYQLFSRIILDPPATDSDEQRTQRSWKAMKLLIDDLNATSGGESYLLNQTKAGLLAKEIFASIGKPDTNILHVRTLLETLLEAHPSSVISAACAGGKDGMERHLGPLLAAETSSQTLPTITHIILYGCLGKQGKPSAEQTVMQHQQAMQKTVALSNGHRRKFVRALSDWSVLSQLIQCISAHERENPSIGEDVCETILTIVECLGYPEKQPSEGQPQKKDKSETIGEEHLLAPLGQQEWWDPLVAMLDGDTSDAAKVAATRIMMGIFTLATGRSSRIRKLNSVMTDATESSLGETKVNEIDLNADKDLPHENKLLDWGLTSRIHHSLLKHLPQLIHALLRGINNGVESGATQYFGRGGFSNDIPGVVHPGRCCIVPFTSWRLHVCILLAELFTHNEPEEKGGCQHANCDEEAQAFGPMAMNAVMGLTLPPALHTNNDDQFSESTVFNPWPFLCDWVFEYPENTLYHFQFIRLFKAICMEHHEGSLRLVLQKLKFVSRAVKTCSSVLLCANRGALLVCLNVLRLRSHSLAPSAFLCQFLKSHDAWKGFQEELLRMTLEQERRGHPVPSKESCFGEPISVDLGSTYAVQLGFDGMETYHADIATGQQKPSVEEGTDINNSKKKKKKKRKKKK